MYVPEKSLTKIDWQLLPVYVWLVQIHAAMISHTLVIFPIADLIYDRVGYMAVLL